MIWQYKSKSYVFTYIGYKSINFKRLLVSNVFITLKNLAWRSFLSRKSVIQGLHYMHPRVLFSDAYWSWVARETHYHGIELVLQILKSIPGFLPGALISIQIKTLSFVFRWLFCEKHFDVTFATLWFSYYRFLLRFIWYVVYRHHQQRHQGPTWIKYHCNWVGRIPQTGNHGLDEFEVGTSQLFVKYFILVYLDHDFNTLNYLAKIAHLFKIMALLRHPTT